MAFSVSFESGVNGIAKSSEAKWRQQDSNPGARGRQSYALTTEPPRPTWIEGRNESARQGMMTTDADYLDVTRGKRILDPVLLRSGE